MNIAGCIKIIFANGYHIKKIGKEDRKLSADDLRSTSQNLIGLTSCPIY